MRRERPVGTVFQESLGHWGLGGKHGRRTQRHRDDCEAQGATGGGPGARWAGQANSSLTLPNAVAGGSGLPGSTQAGVTRTMPDEYSRKGGPEFEKLGTRGAESPHDIQTPFPLLQLPDHGAPSPF